MTKDPFDIMLETSLKHVARLGDLAANLAYHLYRTMDGDDVQDSARELLRDAGYTDENDEWIGDEEE